MRARLGICELGVEAASAAFLWLNYKLLLDSLLPKRNSLLGNVECNSSTGTATKLEHATAESCHTGMKF